MTAQGEAEYAERLRLITEDILSRGSLTELVQRPALDLYRGERSRRPLENIIDDMRRRDLRIAPTRYGGRAGVGPVTAIEISFEYADRDKAQAVVRELVTKLTEGTVRALHKLAIAQDGADRKPGGDEVSDSPDLLLMAHGVADGKPDRDLSSDLPMLEVLDPPSLPASPISPNRPAVAAIGLAAGLLLGSLLALGRWLLARQTATPGPRPTYWKYALAAAVLGGLTAGLESFPLPDRYVSTAVLRAVPSPDSGAITGQTEIEYTARLRQLTQEILSRDSLAELIQRASIDLYRGERSRRPMEAIVDEMRHRDLRIALTSTFGMAVPGHPTTFEISFEYADRHQAQVVVRE